MKVGNEWRGRAPNYALKDNHTFSRGMDSFTLPEGSYINPINEEYIPKHVLESPACKYYYPATETICFTRYGFIPIPKKLITVR